MSNDVWGTPVVADDLLYVTSFEVHALDVASGRRQFKTRDVAWSMAVAGGRIHASDGPTPVRAGRAGRHRALAAAHRRLGLLPQGRPRHRRHRHPRRRRTGLGGRQRREAVGDSAAPRPTSRPPRPGPRSTTARSTSGGTPGCCALEARTGEERWSYPIGDAASCGGVPVRVTPAEDGVRLRRAPAPASSRSTSPTGAVRWHFEAPAVFLCPPAFAPGPAVTGGGVYLADYLGTVYALDATDRPATAGASPRRPGTRSSRSLVADGHVHRRQRQARSTPSTRSRGTPTWRFAAGGDVVGAPVVAEGRVHFGSADHLPLHARRGRRPAALEAGHRAARSPARRWPSGGVVYACSKDRCVYALDAAKGTGQARQS